MAELRVEEGGKELGFRSLLLARCKKEFDTNDEGTTVKAKRRMLANIRFIGELYKLGMLKQKVIHSCIRTLLGRSRDEAIECLCRLLTAVGGQLEAKQPRTSEVRPYKVGAFWTVFSGDFLGG